MAVIERGAFRPVASPRDTVAVQTRFTDGVAPLAPIRPLAPEAPPMPRPPRQGPSALAQLGEALGALNPRINTALDKFYKGQQEADSLDAELRAMRDNATSWSEAVKADPTLADRSPYFRQVYEGRAARTLVQRKSGELLAEYYSSSIAGSDDPGAINQWLTERMSETIDTATSPAQRMAMIEEVQKLSGQFISAHRENAVRNLVQNSLNSLGTGLGVALDNYAAQGGSYNEGAPSGSYYQALSGAESGGRNIANLEGTSSAFGIYQFTSGTWADLMKRHPGLGLTAAGRGDTRQQQVAIRQFTADNAAALAQAGIPVNDKNLYMSHFLGEAGGPRFLQALAQNPDASAASSVTQDALVANRSVFYDKNGRPRTNREVYARMTRKFGTESTHAADVGAGASGGLTGLATTVHEMESEMRLQGHSPDKVNEVSIQAVTMKMLQHDDETLADVLLQPRPDGTPGAGMTLAGQQAIEQAKQQVLNARTQRQNAEHTQQERERKEAIRQAKGMAMEGLMEQIMAGQSPALDPQIIRDAAAIDADLAADLVAVHQSLSSYDKTEDRDEVNHVAHGVMSGLLGVDDVFLAVRDGKLKDPTTIRNLYDDARRNDTGGFTQDPLFKTAMSDIENLVGDPLGGGVLNSPEQAVQAQMMLRRSFMGFMEDNPRASERQKIEFLEGETSAVVKRFKPSTEYDAWRDGDPSAPTSGAATAPALTPTPSQTPAPNVAPASGFNWQNRPAYADRATLDREYQEFLDGGSTNNFSLWVSRLGFTSSAQIREFVEAQRKLGGQQQR